MIKVENVEVWGFEHAIRGMRNPMNSWQKSDSKAEAAEGRITVCYWGLETYAKGKKFVIGPNDMALMKKLTKAGPEHRKFLRQIFVSMDITAPLYWWKEFDTYKIGTVANSCSTMHKIHTKPFGLSDFSIDQLNCDVPDCFYDTLDYLNESRKKFLETKDKKYWWQMIQLLPSSYNQRRTVTMTYENALTMIHQRKEHKLDEWREGLVPELMKLPYMEELAE